MDVEAAEPAEAGRSGQAPVLVAVVLELLAEEEKNFEALGELGGPVPVVPLGLEFVANQ